MHAEERVRGSGDAGRASYTSTPVETWDAISTRRNVRRFADRPIEERDLERIVEAARLAPSSMNEQRWAFIVCIDREHVRRLAGSGDYAGHLAGAPAAIAFLTPSVDDAAEAE